jgi:hypothetical protein
MVSISAEANVAAKNGFTLLKKNPFPFFRATVLYTPSYLCWINLVAGAGISGS